MPLLTDLLIQSDLLAQQADAGQWGDILVLVVMGIVWLAAGLARAINARKGTQQGHSQKAGATRKDDRRGTWQDRLVRKAKEFQRAAEAKVRELDQAATGVPHKRVAPPQPPAGKITVRHGAAGDSVMVFERPVSQPHRGRDTGVDRRDKTQRAVALVNRQIARPCPPESLSEPFVEMQQPSLKPLAASTASLAQPVSLRSTDVIDYSDPDALKKAILHREIFGKPLALRESTDEASLF